MDGENKIKIKIGEEELELTPEEIGERLGQAAELSEKLSKAEPMFRMAEKYGVDPETLLRQSEGSVALVSKLLDDGVINERGEVVKSNTEPSPPPRNPSNTDLPWPPGSRDKDTTGAEKVAEIIAKALEPISGRLKSLEGDIVSMTERNIRSELKAKHSGLSERDVTYLLQTAMADRSKNLWEHAEEFAGAKKEERAALRKEHAKEFGIDADEFDANKLKQQESGGGTAAILQGRSISFKKDAEGKSVTPREATTEFFKQQAAQGES